MTEPISVRLERARQKDFISVQECALLVGCSERTIWRRLPGFPTVIRDGRLVRIHRKGALNYFLRKPLATVPPPASA